MKIRCNCALHIVVQDHDFFNSWCEMLRACHLAHSIEMFELLVVLMGKKMDEHQNNNNKLMTFWNEYCIGRWACWSIAHSAAEPISKHISRYIMMHHRELIYIDTYQNTSTRITSYQHESFNERYVNQCDCDRSKCAMQHLERAAN